MRAANDKPVQRKNATRNGARVSIRKNFATHLRESAEALDLSHTDIADALGKSERTVGAWMRGENRIDLEAIARHPALYNRFIRCLYVGAKRGRR